MYARLALNLRSQQDVAEGWHLKFSYIIDPIYVICWLIMFVLSIVYHDNLERYQQVVAWSGLFFPVVPMIHLPLILTMGSVPNVYMTFMVISFIVAVCELFAFIVIGKIFNRISTFVILFFAYFIWVAGTQMAVAKRFEKDYGDCYSYRQPEIHDDNHHMAIAFVGFLGFSGIDTANIFSEYVDDCPDFSIAPLVMTMIIMGVYFTAYAILIIYFLAKFLRKYFGECYYEFAGPVGVADLGVQPEPVQPQQVQPSYVFTLGDSNDFKVDESPEVQRAIEESYADKIV